MDPSPFHEKDLDHDAEEFIVSWMQEYPLRDPVSLVVHVNQSRDDAQQLVEAAVHHYFAYRTKLNRMELHRLLKQGRISLVIGLAFLAACLLASELLLRLETSPFLTVLRTSLTIAGWVAMWRPMQIFLYEWWPIRRVGRIFEKMSHMPVEVKKRHA